MKLLFAPSQAAAQALADKVQAFLVSNDANYNAVKWDDPRQNPTSGQWAIAFEDRFAPAFTPTERGDTASTDAMGQPIMLWANVVAYTPDWNPPVAP